MNLSPWVDVLNSGYKWNGELYPTLTHISRKATGYQIEGNTFFGLPVKRRGECPPFSAGVQLAFSRCYICTFFRMNYGLTNYSEFTSAHNGLREVLENTCY